MKTVATDELDALSEALEDPDGNGLAEALQRVADAARRHLEMESPSSADFMARMVVVLKGMPGIDRATPRLEALIDALQYFYLKGPLDRVDFEAETISLARRSGHILLRKALMLSAVYDAESANIPRAIERFAEALDVARAQGDIQAIASIWTNLGGAFAYSAQYRDALASWEHVIHLVNTCGVALFYGKAAEANIAFGCLHTGDIERGLRAAESALRGLEEPRTKQELVVRTQREETYARLLLEAGEMQAARDHAAIALRYAAQSSSPRAEIAAAMTQGLCDVYSGRAAAGLELLTQMADQSRRDMPIILREVLTMQVKACQFLDMPREALAHLQELLELQTRWHHDNALEHVRLQLEPLNAEGEPSTPFYARLRSQEALLRGKVAEQDLFVAPREMLDRLAVMAELREDSTGEHCYRIGKLAALLAVESGVDTATCVGIERAARLHDIGKSAIPDSVILKRGKLTDAERGIMRTHSAIGADLLAKSNIPQMEMAEQIARHHHDWWDGSKGGIHSGGGIPYAARVVAIADVFDALTHDRPHRAAWSSHEALREIARMKGKQFDPQLADLFVEMIARLRREHRDLDAFLGEAAKSSRFLQARSRITDALQSGQ